MSLTYIKPIIRFKLKPGAVVSFPFHYPLIVGRRPFVVLYKFDFLLNEKANLETRTRAPVNRLLSFLNSSIIIHHFKGTDTPPLRIKSLFKIRIAGLTRTASFSATFLGLSQFSRNSQKTKKTLCCSGFQKKNDASLRFDGSGIDFSPYLPYNLAYSYINSKTPEEKVKLPCLEKLLHY